MYIKHRGTKLNLCTRASALPQTPTQTETEAKSALNSNSATYQELVAFAQSLKFGPTTPGNI